MNEGKKALVDDAPAPSRNDEYLLYQTLLGSFPPGNPRGKELADYRERILAYMQKATREAKVRTSWAHVNEAYEAATAAFVNALLDDTQPNAFLDDFRAAASVVTWIGFLNSLSMAAVKLTSPGVPDIYQGNETWDFSLVDPDNRRPARFPRAALARLDAGAAPDGPAEEKLALTAALLRLRRDRPELFTGYAPLRAEGPAAEHCLAFARPAGLVTVVTRLAHRLAEAGGWRGTGLALPPGRWLPLRPPPGGAAYTGPVTVAELLGDSPVTVLLRTGED
jgi:(1->4)-alpha-D-glucan 1-alpha-D-glucosylmutase